MSTDEQAISRDLTARVGALLDTHDHRTRGAQEFLGARFDAGLAWVHFPEGHGGLGVPQSFQARTDHCRFRHRGADASVSASAVDR